MKTICISLPLPVAKESIELMKNLLISKIVNEELDEAQDLFWYLSTLIEDVKRQESKVQEKKEEFE